MKKDINKISLVNYISENTSGSLTVDYIDIKLEQNENKKNIINILESGIGKTPEQINQLIKKLEFGEMLNDAEIEAIDFKIKSNNPSLGIFDNLKSGDNYQSIIFSGIKSVNDQLQLGQKFTDSVLNSFKHELLSQYPGILPVWNDYKNFVLKKDFPEIISNNELEKLLNDSYIYQLNKLSKIPDTIPKLGTISEIGMIEGNFQEDIMYSLAKTRSNLETTIHGKEINLLSSEELVEKLDNMINDFDLHSQFREEKVDERGRSKYITEKGVLSKIYTIAETGKTVTDRMLILDTNGNINSQIIKLVRKDKIPSNLQIYKDVNQIIKSAIANGEFIGPYIRDVLLEEGNLISPQLLQSYKNIKNKLKKGVELNTEELKFLKQITQKTYKEAFDKNTFCSKINKPGELFFIDIEGMGDINIQDFIDHLRKYNSDEITEKELLLNSGSLMTVRFRDLLINLQDSLNKLYPGKEINYYIGGDEIGIFIEGLKVSENNIIIEIYNELYNNILDGRITRKLINEEELLKGGKKLLEEVDRLTKYSKIIEVRVDQAIEKIKLHEDEEYSLHTKGQLNILKKFDISEENGVKIITFHPKKGEELLEKGNSFKLNEIINIKTLKLQNDSPLIKYLIKNILER